MRAIVAARLRASHWQIQTRSYCCWHPAACSDMHMQVDKFHLLHTIPNRPVRRSSRIVVKAQLVSDLRATKPWLSFAAPCVWRGLEEDVLKVDMPLTPLWKLMLLSDGSVTRHLQLLTSSRIHVDCLEMADIGDDTHGLPDEVHAIPSPRVQRQVLLRSHGGTGPVLVYASSWWDAAQVNKYLTDVRKPIWTNLSEGHFELYRDIQSVYCGDDEGGELSKHFGCEGPFWGRQYAFWHDGRPLTQICEVFSPRLCEYLGPTHRLTNGNGTHTRPSQTA